MEKKSLISNRSSKKATVSKPGANKVSATKVSATKLAKPRTAVLHRVAAPARLQVTPVTTAKRFS
jgi:hypothetical protein